MAKIKDKQLKKRSGDRELFIEDGTDEFYMKVKNEAQSWHSAAKIYWQKLYDKHFRYLDKGFRKSLATEGLNRLWELTLVEFIAQNESKGARLIELSGPASKPDFCFALRGQRFYLEAVSARPGDYPELNVAQEDITGMARHLPVQAMMERICSAFRYKAETKYYGEETCGYKCHMEESSGLIIAVSMANIPFHNQTHSFEVDLRHFFGMSEFKLSNALIRKKYNIVDSRNSNEKVTFRKLPKEGSDKEGAQIKIDYFANDQFSHVSAILLSHSALSFFPDIDQFFDDCHLPVCRNDYTLVHNPFAKTPLPVGFFQVKREVVTTEAGIKIYESPI